VTTWLVDHNPILTKESKPGVTGQVNQGLRAEGQRYELDGVATEARKRSKSANEITSVAVLMFG
jgi:hypothetical protein